MTSHRTGLALIGRSEDGAESPDDQILYLHLLKQGVDVKRVDWKASSNALRDVDCAVVRSPYDYTDHLDNFLAAMERIERDGVRLFNASRVIRWNASKKYLADLESNGVRIVPSVFSDAVTPAFRGLLTEMLERSAIVLKPMVGAGGAGIHIVTSVSEFEHALSQEDYTRGVIAQRYFDNISDDGEYSLIFFAGKYSHTILKKPAAGNFLVQEEHGGASSATTPSDTHIDVARHALAVSAQCCETDVKTLLYARVDLLPDADGTLYLSEIELIEPQLFFEQDPKSVVRFTEALSELR